MNNHPGTRFSSLTLFTIWFLLAARYFQQSILELIQGIEYLVANLIDLAHAFDLDVFGSGGFAGLFPIFVVADQRLGLGMIYVQALADGLFFVVFALNQILAGFVVLALDLGGLKTMW